TANPRDFIVQLAFTKWFTRTKQVARALASSSTRKIASIAKLATSRTRQETLTGPRRKVGADRTIRICEPRYGAKSPLSPASKGYGKDSRLAARSDFSPASKGRAFTSLFAGRQTWEI